jgi:hypothetical protein
MHLGHVQMKINMYLGLIHLRSLDCNLADREYISIQEQEAQQEEEAREPAPELVAEEPPTTLAFEGKPRFYA